jgi:hypothetical protein
MDAGSDAPVGGCGCDGRRRGHRFDRCRARGGVERELPERLRGA